MVRNAAKEAWIGNFWGGSEKKTKTKEGIMLVRLVNGKEQAGGFMWEAAKLN